MTGPGWEIVVMRGTCPKSKAAAHCVKPNLPDLPKLWKISSLLWKVNTCHFGRFSS